MMAVVDEATTATVAGAPNGGPGRSIGREAVKESHS